MHSFAAGNRAKALHTGSFVWADSTYADFASTAANQFLVRAANAGINTPSPQATLDIVTQNRDQAALRLQNTAADGWATIRMADAGHYPSISFYYGALIDGYDAAKWLPNIGFYNANGSYLVLRESADYAGGGYVRSSVSIWARSLNEGSDRNLKTNIEPVDPTDTLQRVLSLPVST